MRAETGRQRRRREQRRGREREGESRDRERDRRREQRQGEREKEEEREKGWRSAEKRGDRRRENKEQQLKAHWRQVLEVARDGQGYEGDILCPSSLCTQHGCETFLLARQWDRGHSFLQPTEAC